MEENVNHPDEEWRCIKFLLGKYEVSQYGRIRKTDTRKIRKTPTSKRGYPVFSCYINGKMKLVTVHKCVATEFLPNPDNKREVNHIDGNKENNFIGNLEWVTPRQNMLHARKIGLHKSDGDKPVLMILNGVVINKFRSASQAERETGISRSNICNVCNKRIIKRSGGVCKTAGGYEWEWEKIA